MRGRYAIHEQMRNPMCAERKWVEPKGLEKVRFAKWEKWVRSRPHAELARMAHERWELEDNIMVVFADEEFARKVTYSYFADGETTQREWSFRPEIRDWLFENDIVG